MSPQPHDLKAYSQGSAWKWEGEAGLDGELLLN